MFSDHGMTDHLPTDDPDWSDATATVADDQDESGYQELSAPHDHHDDPAAPGDIVVHSGGHLIDAGPARYDLDGDGRAETAVLEVDGRLVQVSDVDGDHRADEMLQVDEQTGRAAILVDSGSGTWQVAATGHVDESGDFVPDHAGVATVSPASAGAPDSGDGQDHPAAVPPIVYTSTTGVETDLGAPNQDLDGDGRDESVAVHTADGTVLVVSDTDADGTPDQIISIDPDTGTATWAVPDGHGGWHVVQTGTVAADGSLVVGAPAEPGGATGVTAGDDGHPHTGPAQPGTAHTVTIAPEGGSTPGVVVPVGGSMFQAGTATIDSDGDGVPDTVSVPGPAGTTLFYEDSDGDGVADRAWTTDPSGSVTATYPLTADGGWAPTGAAGAGAGRSVDTGSSGR